MCCMRVLCREPIQAKPCGSTAAGWSTNNSRPCQWPASACGLVDRRSHAGCNSRINGQQGEIWLYDTERRVSSPLPLGPASDATQPIFSPDGSQIYFRKVIDRGFATIARQPVSGVTQPVEVLRAVMSETLAPLAVTIDPPRLLYVASLGRRGLRPLPLNGAAKPTPYVDQADTRIMMAALSPDNRHVALILGQPLQAQLFVQTFPDPNARALARVWHWRFVPALAAGREGAVLFAGRRTSCRSSRCGGSASRRSHQAVRITGGRGPVGARSV